MKKAILALLLVLSLISTLCIGFVLGVLTTPVMSRAANLVERIVTRNSSGLDGRPDVFIVPPEWDESGPTQPGVEIISIVTNGPADQAGLTTGQTIISLDGKPIYTSQDLLAELAKHDPGDTVEIEVQDQDGNTHKVTVELGENPQREGNAWLGIQYGTPTPSLFNQEGTPFSPDKNWPRMPRPPGDMPFSPRWEHPGALIKNVVSGSPAEDAGLQSGQLIQAVDGEKISSTNTLSDIIATHEPGDTITLTVFTSGNDANNLQEVKVKLGENPEANGVAWLGVEYSIIDINIVPDEGPEG